MTNMTSQKFETIIGLEVHLQLQTNTKIFCGSPNQFGQAPNSQVSPVSLGLPGTLPVLNKAAVLHAIKVALALNCKVNQFIKFDRKNYYYPDLPKGYQISQFDHPIASDGSVTISTPNGEKKIRIKRAHLEEDAGKLIHDDKNNCSLVDYNRTGTPLLEIVTEPDLHSPQEAYDYLTTLKLSLQYLNVSDCDMEKGSLRCDANISIRPIREKELGTKAELKNLNSFKAVKTALAFEVNRQEKLVLAGERIVQETRLWNENKQITVSMRSKEEAHDYRYFPEPDLVPFTIDKKTIDDVRKALPESPDQKLNRLIDSYKISDYDAQILVQDPKLAEFFEECTKHTDQTKKICNWINGSILQELNERKKTIDQIKIKPTDIAMLISKIEDGTLNNLSAKEAFKHIIKTGKSADNIIKKKGLAQVSDQSELENLVDKLITEHEKVANQIREGKESAVGFLVGQAMRQTKGKANPKLIGEIIKRRLQNGK